MVNLDNVDINDLESVRQAIDDADYARLLGMTITELKKGFARVECRIEARHQNLYQATHGGAIFSIADHACSAAGNSLGRNAVMIQSGITFFANPRLNETVIAEAEILHSGRRTAYMDILVRTESGKNIAKCQAVVYFI
ncbi:MAG: PaaI family thioesterase [Deltaproteobacteria bacterium]|nr:PaaI family thioesterase [Deltaproteobacteria bacterium]